MFTVTRPVKKKKNETIKPTKSRNNDDGTGSISCNPSALVSMFSYNNFISCKKIKSSLGVVDKSLTSRMFDPQVHQSVG